MSICYPANLFGKFTEYLKDEKYRFISNEKEGVIFFGIAMRGNLANIQYQILVEEKSFVSYAICPISGDVRNRKQMAELSSYLHFANHGLLPGNFEFDLKGGEIRFKYFVNCAGMVLTDEIIENSVRIPAEIFSRFIGGIFGIIFYHMNAAEAIALSNSENCTVENEKHKTDSYDDDTIPPVFLDFLKQLHDEKDKDDSDIIK